MPQTLGDGKAGAVRGPAAGAPLAPAVPSLPDLVRVAAERTPDHLALVLPAPSPDGSGASETWTWAQLEEAVEATAQGLAARGLPAGARVALLLDNVPAFPVAFYGALRAGLVAVPMNPGLAPPEVEHVLRDSGAALLVTSSDRAAAGAYDVDVVVAGGTGAGTLTQLQDDGRAQSRALPRRDPEELAVLLYTSGTSGRPKGAMLSSRALLANLEQVSAIDPPVVTPDDVVLVVLPMSHVYGLNTVLGMIARHGATGVLVPRFDPVATLSVVQHAGVTCLVGAPPMFASWSLLPEARERLAAVRLALSGAAPLPADVSARFAELTGHHVFEGYGLTETSPGLTSTLCSDVARAGSLGRPLPGVELRLQGADGQPVEEGDPGEIAVRGANLFSGYWPDGAGGPDAEGWWATGDLAYLGADGDLHLVDRRRELILVSGFNVYPAEVERVLLGHPDVADAAVLGVPHPYTGEAVKAFVVARPGASIDPDELLAFCATRLARFKCPTVVEVVAALPHSATGKVRKGRLREQGA